MTQTAPATLLADQSTAAADPGFRARINQAATTVALQVQAEDTTTAAHAARAAFASAVLRGLVPQLPQALATAASTDGTGPASTDLQILTRVDALWTSLS